MPQVPTGENVPPLPGPRDESREQSLTPAETPADRGAPADPAAMSALLAEYNSLRQESLQAITNRIQIMNFAFTSLAVVLAALLTSSVSPAVLIPVSLVFVPAAAKASLLIWLGEYHRSQRAGRGVAQIERRINALLGADDHVGWESRLISSNTHMGYPYVATSLFILSTGVLGEGLGGYFLVDKVREEGPAIAVAGTAAAVAAYAVVVEVLFVRFFLRRWRIIRTATHTG